jgi:hypothetical protein
MSSTLTGLLYLALAGTMGLAASTLVDVLMIVGGTVAAPIWAVLLIRAIAATEKAEPRLAVRGRASSGSYDRAHKQSAEASVLVGERWSHVRNDPRR